MHDTLSVPFVDTGSYPTRAGNSVVPWIDGDRAFRRICEAIDNARESVWVTVTFMWPSFQMPGGRGSALDVLETAASRGVDVRVIFWRPDEETAGWRDNAFWGSPEHLELLSRRYSHLDIRWDRAHPGYCQHQKTWLIDPRRNGGTTFVGGINLNPHSVVTTEHRGRNHNHDVYVEVTGPAVVDVDHNFVQRWNEASERARADGRFGERSAEDLAFPADIPRSRGSAVVQIQRTVHPGRYTDTHPSPGGAPFPIARGERTIRDQYCAAIETARRTIYLEQQYLDDPVIISALDKALQRGVHVLAMMPAATELAGQPGMLQSSHANFTLCGMAGVDASGVRTPVYVHSKLMIVDDEWASVGSCNLHHYSLFGNGELNVACRDATAVKAMRIALFQEHLGCGTSTLNDVDALRLFRALALENRTKHERGDSGWQGLAFSRHGMEARQ